MIILILTKFSLTIYHESIFVMNFRIIILLQQELVWSNVCFLFL